MHVTEKQLREVETLLADAAAKAEAAVAMLDLSRVPCEGGCGHSLMADYTHGKVYERIGPVAGKLRVAAVRLRNAHEGRAYIPDCPHCRALAMVDSDALLERGEGEER